MEFSTLYIGLMSGTSLDGIDAVIVDFSQSMPQLIASHYHAYPDAVRHRIAALCQPGENEIERLGQCDVLLGRTFADTVHHLLEKSGISSDKIRAIGSHGQTIRHHPEHAFTIQMGDPNIIVAKTKIITVADFRRRDMALGGQGAPLVPAFHKTLFQSEEYPCAVVNIGGIANVTLLSTDASHAVVGFDTGPGNTLLDAWIQKHLKKSFDMNGEWGASGQINHRLLDKLLDDSYFKKPSPKSTGREYFNLKWLQNHLNNISDQPVNIQATLTALTAHSVVQSITPYFSKGEILLCGGGAYNDYLIKLIKALAPHHTVNTTEKTGLPPKWIEAMAFAWLAKQTLEHQPGNLASVTGATRATILGGVYYP